MPECSHVCSCMLRLAGKRETLRLLGSLGALRSSETFGEFRILKRRRGSLGARNFTEFLGAARSFQTSKKFRASRSLETFREFRGLKKLDRNFERGSLSIKKLRNFEGFRGRKNL